MGTIARPGKVDYSVEAETAYGLPDYVKTEFEAFLDCGILANGFLRLQCGQCHHEKLVAFSCKKRGFCPSCGARRMADDDMDVGGRTMQEQLSNRLPTW